MRLAISLSALALACGPTAAPTPVTPVAQTPVEAEPPDWLADAELPALPADAAEGLAPARPALVFQSVARNNVVAADFTADGRALVTLGGDGESSVIDLATGRIRAGRRVFVRRAIRGLRVSARGVAYVINGTSFGTSGGVRAWDLRTGRLREVELPDVAFVDVQGLALEERSERLALVHEHEGEVMLRLQGPVGAPRDQPVSRAFPSFTPNGLLLLRFADGGYALRTFDAAADDNRLEAAPEAEEGQVFVAVHPRGEALFTTGTGRPLTWRDPISGERIAEVAIEHGSPLKYVMVSGDGERLGLLREDGTLELRSTRDGEALGTTTLPESWSHAFNGREGLQLGHAGERLYYLGRQALVIVPLRQGEDEPVEPLEVPLEDYTSGMELSADGRWLAVLGRSLTLFDLEATEAEEPGPEPRRFEPRRFEPRRFEPRGGEHSVWGLQWTPDERSLVTYGRGGVEIWGADGFRATSCRGSGTVVWGESPSLFLGARRCELSTGEHEEVAPALAASVDHRRVLVDQGSHVAVLGAGGERLGRVRKPRGAPVCRYGQCVSRHSLSADGEVLAFATEHQASVHDRRGRRRGRLQLPESQGPIAALGLSPDGQALLVFQTGAGNGLRATLHRVRGMQQLAELDASSVEHFAFAPGSDLLAVAQGAELVLVDVASGRTLATHDAEAPILSVAVTPDGRAVVVRTAGGLRVLDRDGAPRATRNGLALPWAVSADAEKLVRCEAGVLVLSDLLTQATTTLGDCTRGDELSFSPRGTYITARRGSYVEVHRVTDGHGLALHAPRIDENLDRSTHAYAVDTDGSYELAEGADPEKFLYRRAGPMLSAPLVTLTEAPGTPGLVAGFFGAASAEPEAVIADD